jgi:hypothetical protein
LNTSNWRCGLNASSWGHRFREKAAERGRELTDQQEAFGALLASAGIDDPVLDAWGIYRSGEAEDPGKAVDRVLERSVAELITDETKART